MNNIILKTYEDERINKELKKCFKTNFPNIAI